MRKWEMKYNELKNGNLDITIKKLKLKMDEKTITKDEYKEYNRLLKIKENMPKIANIIEYREKLTKEIAVLDKELEAVERLEYFETNSDRIDAMFKRTNAKLNKLVSEKTRIEKQLKNKNLSQEEKDELLSEKRNITEQIDENNEKYAKMQRVLGQKQSLQQNHGKYSKEQLETRKNTFLQRVSKCNMVGNKLVKGLSWDSIEMDLENWQNTRLTSKEPITKNVERVTAKSRESSETLRNTTTPIRGTGKVTVTENLPAKVGRFTKMKNAIKNWILNTFTYTKEENAEKEEPSKNENTPELSETEQKESERSEFTKYLKEVAEKGYKEVDRERAMQKREKEMQAKKEAHEKAMKRHKELKREAYERESEKYGKEYAERSMKQEDEQR